MSFTMELYELLIRYTKDSEGLEITLKELQYIDWWRCVWGNWKAQAYYNINHFYQKVEDVPEGITDYWIVSDKVATQYFTRKDGSKVVQAITKEECKSIYG